MVIEARHSPASTVTCVLAAGCMGAAAAFSIPWYHLQWDKQAPLWPSILPQPSVLSAEQRLPTACQAAKCLGPSPALSPGLGPHPTGQSLPLGKAEGTQEAQGRLPSTKNEEALTGFALEKQFSFLLLFCIAFVFKIVYCQVLKPKS